jgi:1-acyl-sn-glycerol-3-phosphate acyltransferase
MVRRNGRVPARGPGVDAASVVAAGAARAAGERERRRSRRTPLVPVPEPVREPVPDGPSEDRSGPRAADDVRVPRETTVRRGRERDRERDRRERYLAVAEDAARAGHRLAAIVEGVAPNEVDERIVTALAFLRRRLTGEYRIDEFGFDPELTEVVLFSLLRPLYQRWFRVEVRGVENIPAEGGALVVGNHSGAVALDSLMVALAVHDEHPRNRFLRLLGADLVFRTPFIGEYARKSGATLATPPDVERLLSAGELVGVWPEGFKGVGKPFSERYKLQRFGRGGFVTAALRTRTPIVPCSIVGAEETYPIIGNFPRLARALGLPYVPVTPTWPWLGPLGLVPLPSKWLIEFGDPVPTEDYEDGAAEDPMLVFDLTDQVRQTIQKTLYTLLLRRRSVFFS